MDLKLLPMEIKCNRGQQQVKYSVSKCVLNKYILEAFYLSIIPLIIMSFHSIQRHLPPPTPLNKSLPTNKAVSLQKKSPKCRRLGFYSSSSPQLQHSRPPTSLNDAHQNNVFKETVVSPELQSCLCI